MGELRVRPLGYALGAEVSGVDLSKPLTEAVVAEIRRTWLQYIVLCFPGQNLGSVELMAFCSRFGELDDNRRSPQYRDPDYAPIQTVSNTPVLVNGTPILFPAGQRWHSDRQFTDHPASGSFLVAKELPDVGGNTLFANMYAAYETLSPAMQRLIEPLEGVFDQTMASNFSKKTPDDQADYRRRNPPVVHPIVRTHEETGRKALFIGEIVRNFIGMTEEETKPLRDFLIQHATRYELTYRHVWTVYDLVVWDNRCAMHHALPDFDPKQRRRMLRCALLAEKSGRTLEEAEAAPKFGLSPAVAGR